MICNNCNAAIQVKERVQFRERCQQCDAPLHACVNCGFYAPGAYNDCREPKAERVVEKKRENRCEYFIPGDNTKASQSDPEDGKNKFDRLFS